MGAVTKFQFAIGNGVATAFTLMDPSGAVADTPSVTALYRTDWQGEQLLYTTARTNFCTKSQQIADATWTNLIAGSGSAPVPTANYAVGPEGALNATRVQFQVGAAPAIGDYSFRNTPTLNGLSVGQPLIVSFWAKSNTADVTLTIQGGTASVTNTTATLTTTLQRFTALLGNATAVSGVLRFGLRGTFTSALTADITITDFQVEQNGLAAATNFILTDAAAVTVTDYSAAGTTVTLAVPPLSTAPLAWTGTDNNGPFIPGQDGAQFSVSYGAMGVR